MFANIQGNSEYIGKVIDTILQPSSLVDGVSGVQLQQAQGATLSLAGGNGSGASTIDLTSAQLLAAQFHPLVIKSANSGHDIVLRPNGLAHGNEAAYFLQQTFGLHNAGDAAMFLICQTGTATNAVVLNGDSQTNISTALGINTVSIAALVVGDETDSTVIITST
jgi:ABC-type glutathione transport system ATPase component